MSRPFRMLMIALFMLLALGIWLFVLGLRSSPISMPFVSSV